MATLGSLYHDFPRLAKQSGFYFQLHTGRVNWSEIENLNVDEIIEKRNYELLERNLINVINCNLEREYDLKILDQNFVKLFKLAQLGIDYLFYCEMYLDKCVVLLQEQLTSFQEEYESLKHDNEKKKENLNKSKRKSKVQREKLEQSYQCEKCEKVFISDVYLKFHDKRRHSNPNTPNSLDTSEKKCTDSGQQTEGERKLSASTQTFCLEDGTCPQDSEDRDSIKKEHTVKIEKLEQELKDLKERLKKAETSLIQKVENSQLNQSSALHSLNVTGSMCCNSMLMPMLIPSYLKQPSNGYYEVSTACQQKPLLEVSVPVPELCQHPVNPATTEIKSGPENKSQLSTESGNTFGKELELSKEETKLYMESTEGFREYQHKRTENLDYDKENVDPNLKMNLLKNSTKPLPPPRKLKKGIRTEVFTPDRTPTEAFKSVKEDTNKEEENEGFNNRSIVHRSTPIKEKPNKENAWETLEVSRENLSEINKPGSNSTESLNSRKSISTDHESKSLIKKLVARNSPKLRRFSRNFKRSLTNLYDSVSSTEKDSKKRNSSEQNIKSAAVNELNNRLRELGVDPEWQGIPKKTMKQKLNVLKHRRKLLSKVGESQGPRVNSTSIVPFKENPMFPVLRQNIEEKIFQKIRNNIGRKKSNLINRLTEQESTNVEDPPQHVSTEDISLKDKSEFVRVKKSAMYNTDTDSESKTSESEGNFTHVPDQNTSQKSVVLEELTTSDEEEEKVNIGKSKEFDFSVFQVGGGTLNSLSEETRQKNVSNGKEVVMLTDSDSEDNSVEHSHDKIFKTLNSYLSIKNRNDIEESSNYENTTQHLEVPPTKAENHGILKEEGLHSRLSVTTKKRVLFANYSDGIEQELSDSPIDDDPWPFKSDSEKDVG